MTAHTAIEEILSELVNQVEWCMNPVAGAVAVDREKEQIAQAKAHQSITTYLQQEIYKAMRIAFFGELVEYKKDRIATIREREEHE